MKLIRVCYGSEDTPKDKREYHLEGKISPIGTIKEWKEFFESNFDKVEIVDEVA